jgi:hypothetical protein
MEARRLMLQADAFLKLDRYREAARALDEAGERAAARHALGLGIEIDLLKGRRLTFENQVAAANSILESALSRARQMGDRYLQSVALNSLAINQIRIFHPRNGDWPCRLKSQVAHTIEDERRQSPDPDSPGR